jgi:hypothetical protein
VVCVTRFDGNDEFHGQYPFISGQLVSAICALFPCPDDSPRGQDN